MRGLGHAGRIGKCQAAFLPAIALTCRQPDGESSRGDCAGTRGPADCRRTWNAVRPFYSMVGGVIRTATGDMMKRRPHEPILQWLARIGRGRNAIGSQSDLEFASRSRQPRLWPTGGRRPANLYRSGRFLFLLVNSALFASTLAAMLAGANWDIRMRATFPFEKDKSLWTQLPWQAGATLLVGIGGLLTFISSKRQKDIHFEREALEKQFNDTLDRLASTDRILRANAVIRLAEMVEECWPGRSRAFSPANYPFFTRALSQLTAALHLEQEQALRDEVVKALRRMIASQAGSSAELRPILLRELADANRSAKRSFIELLSKYCALYPCVNNEALRPLASFAPFCSTRAATLVAIRDLAEGTECTELIRARRFVSSTEGTGASTDEGVNSVLLQIQISGACLIDARNVLVDALRARFTMQDGSSSAEAGADDEEEAMVLFSISRDEGRVVWQVDLEGVFLAGSDLHAVDLSYTNLRSAYLQAANLERSKLQCCSLDSARLQCVRGESVNLNGASLDSACLWAAQLDYARLSSVNLSGSDCRGARLSYVNLTEASLMATDLRCSSLEGANLRDAWCDSRYVETPTDLSHSRMWNADLRGASLCRTLLVGADLTGARLEGANLVGVTVQAERTWRDRNGSPQERVVKANFADTDWRNADFLPPIAGGAPPHWRDRTTEQWLEQHYPNLLPAVGRRTDPDGCPEKAAPWWRRIWKEPRGTERANAPLERETIPSDVEGVASQGSSDADGADSSKGNPAPDTSNQGSTETDGSPNG